MKSLNAGSSGGLAETETAKQRTPDSDRNSTNLLELLQLESEIRRVPSSRELVFHMANESRRVLGFRQAFVFRRKRKWQLAAVSSVNSFAAQSPLNRELQRVVTSLDNQSGGATASLLSLREQSDHEILKGYAFSHALWVPMQNRRGRTFAGLLLLRETPWPTASFPLAERIANTYAHAWEALVGRAIDPMNRISKRALLLALAATALTLGFVRAPLTVLAPAELTGRERMRVSAAMNGVIDEVLVTPNSLVEKGSLVARYDKTELRNTLEIADRATVVARAQLEKLQSASFTDRTAARELKIAEAELALAIAEGDLARDRLEQADIRAPRSGLAVFEDARELSGRPVSLGEHLMDIVDPNDLELTVRLPVKDSIVLREAARARVFLDSNPLQPVEAKVVRRSYRATMHDDGVYGYTLSANLDQSDFDGARLGVQGTAQLFGDYHTLYFIVFRKPYSWIRQTFGL